MSRQIKSIAVFDCPKYYSSFERVSISIRPSYFQWHQFVITESINNKMLKSSESHFVESASKGPNKIFVKINNDANLNMIINKRRILFFHTLLLYMCYRFQQIFFRVYKTFVLVIRQLDTSGDTLLTGSLYFRLYFQVNNKLLFATHLFITSEWQPHKPPLGVSFTSCISVARFCVARSAS